MNSFYKNSINDLYNRESLTKQKAGTEMPSQGGLQTQDYIGLGLQLYGANKADRAAEEERLRQEQKDKEAQDLELTLKGRADRMSAQQFEEQMQNQNRQMNMNGLEYLANQRAEVMKNRRYTTLRNSFAKALSGGN